MIDVDVKGVLYGTATALPHMKNQKSGHVISADSFARMAAFAIGQPDDVDVNEIIFRPTAQQL
jgi:NADP-dependent 3-hydroxy acid dehydrogenase YdfG